MYLEVNRTEAKVFLYKKVWTCVWIMYDCGGRFVCDTELTYPMYNEFVDNMLAAKTALINMLPEEAVIEVFDLVPDLDQDNDIGGVFKMSVYYKKPS